MAAAMSAKKVGELLEAGNLPPELKHFGTTKEELFPDLRELRNIYGKKAKDFSTGAIGVYSYLNRIAFGLKHFAALNRNVVWNVYNQTMQHYHQNGDILQAMIKGAEYGAQKASSQSVYGVYRYKNNDSYWQNFFEKDTTKNHFSGYQDKDTTFQKYFAGLIDFEKSLESGEAVHMNMSLQSVEHYTTTECNLFTKNA